MLLPHGTQTQYQPSRVTPTSKKVESDYWTKVKSLSRTEKDAYCLLVQGLTTQEMANQLCVSPKTIKHHLTNIFKKLAVTNRYKLIATHYQEVIKTL